MNEDTESWKKGLTFTHHKHNPFPMGLVGIASFSCIVIIGLVTTLTINHFNNQNYSSSYSKHVTESELRQEADDYLSLMCDDHDPIPIYTYDLHDNKYLNIYSGKKNYENNRTISFLYFYQFGDYEQRPINASLDFYTLDKHEVIDNITTNTIGQLEINDKQLLTELFVNVYENNELLGNYKII